MAKSLAMINKLTKISNSPFLLRSKDDDKIDEADGPVGNVGEALRLLPHGASLDDVSLSGAYRNLTICPVIQVFPGKLTALAKILTEIRKVRVFFSKVAGTATNL